MRDPKRIPKILERLQKIWEKNPDMRLGQLIENVFPNTDYDYISSYYLEDAKFIRTLENFYSKDRLFGNSCYRRFGRKRNENKNIES